MRDLVGGLSVLSKANEEGDQRRTTKGACTVDGKHTVNTQPGEIVCVCVCVCVRERERASDVDLPLKHWQHCPRLPHGCARWADLI